MPLGNKLIVHHLGTVFFKIGVKALPEKCHLKLVKPSPACALESPWEISTLSFFMPFPK